MQWALYFELSSIFFALAMLIETRCLQCIAMGELGAIYSVQFEVIHCTFFHNNNVVKQLTFIVLRMNYIVYCSQGCWQGVVSGDLQMTLQST